MKLSELRPETGRLNKLRLMICQADLKEAKQRIEDLVTQLEKPISVGQNLFNILRELGITATEDEMQEIIEAVKKDNNEC